MFSKQQANKQKSVLFMEYAISGRSFAGPSPMSPVWPVFAGVRTSAPVLNLYVPVTANSESCLKVARMLPEGKVAQI